MPTFRGLSLSTLSSLALARRQRPAAGLKMFLCIADHYEPKWENPTPQTALERVMRWVHGFPRLAAGIEDFRGRPPQHSFFYPEEEYEPELMEPIAELCRRGFGDVEVHLHHDNDTSDGVREKLERFTQTLHREHGLLDPNASGRPSYGFIHGDWALCNSRPDGRMCGVNNEITILRETGCYADFTMPSAPDSCQTTTINSIYYAVDQPGRPKSHDRGVHAKVRMTPPADSLLMVQGPLGLDWKRRKWGLAPRLETGDLTYRHPPTGSRLKLWLDAGVSVQGREDWRFVKLHTHGTQEANADMLLGEPARKFHKSLRQFARENEGFQYYYVTAREMAGLVHQAEAGVAEPNWEALTRVPLTARQA